MSFLFPEEEIQADIVLIGAGIMSATLGMLLKELQPDLKIEILERLDTVAAESSDAWNNAGTGHSALCELNYTPERTDGSIDCSKAIRILEQFELSRQFWAYLVKKRMLPDPQKFINATPHMSFVHGEENVMYLKKRYDAMQQHFVFKGMEYSEDNAQIAEWIPLTMKGRTSDEKIAVTRMHTGTDVNFGELTRDLFAQLSSYEDVTLRLNNEVRHLDKDEDVNKWCVSVKNLESKKKYKIYAPFVFIGAGGGALPLLEKADIPEAKGFGGFPVSGQWLVCKNPEIIKQHHAKVYGKAGVGTPPMSVPHLDTRIIDGKAVLLFGPFAGFSTRFLKNGSLMDLPGSIQLDNIIPMIQAGIHNIPLTKYLIEQVRQSPEDKLNALREFMPTAAFDDWELAIAGQRVQVIKKDEEEGGVLEFGTEIVAAEDGSIAALLGASPGASTAVSIMLTLLERCFKDKINTDEWQRKLRAIFPFYKQTLSENEVLYNQISASNSEVLNLPLRY
jgi:malate dehydrogenase (quinone)